MKEELPNYCRDCGTRLTWSSWKFFDYQESNGLKRFIAKLICPARRWYQFLHREADQYGNGFYRWGVEFEEGERITVVDDDGKPVLR